MIIIVIITSAEREVRIRDAQECIKVDFFWQEWARKVCRFLVLFGYLTKLEPN